MITTSQYFIKLIMSNVFCHNRDYDQKKEKKNCFLKNKREVTIIVYYIIIKELKIRQWSI